MGSLVDPYGTAFPFVEERFMNRGNPVRSEAAYQFSLRHNNCLNADYPDFADESFEMLSPQEHRHQS
jgi:hypothetical protein